jgi:hypothetical protein
MVANAVTLLLSDLSKQIHNAAPTGEAHKKLRRQMLDDSQIATIAPLLSIGMLKKGSMPSSCVFCVQIFSFNAFRVHQTRSESDEKQKAHYP